MDELNHYRRALELIRDRIPETNDEWGEAAAFTDVQLIAAETLDPSLRDKRIADANATRMLIRRRVSSLNKSDRYFYKDGANGLWVRFLHGDARREGIIHVKVIEPITVVPHPRIRFSFRARFTTVFYWCGSVIEIHISSLWKAPGIPLPNLILPSLSTCTPHPK